MLQILIGLLCFGIVAIGIAMQNHTAKKDDANPFAYASGGIILALPFIAPLFVILFLTSEDKRFPDDSYKLVRFAIPLCFMGIVMLGYTSYCILNSLDSQSTLSSEKLFRNSALLGIVFGIWWVQHIFAPTLLSLAASWAIYNGVVHGSYSLIPIFGFVTEHLLSWGPSWIAEFYTLSSIGYSLVCVVLSFESIDEVLDIFG